MKNLIFLTAHSHIVCLVRPDDSTSFWTMVAALFAGGAACAAFWMIGAQTRQARVDMWRMMVDKFDSAHFCGARHIAAAAWLNPASLGFIKISQCQRVMDFFEDVAYLVNHNRIDKKLARNTFEDSFINYFLATEKIMLYNRA